MLSPQTRVADLLESFPRLTSLLLGLRVDCIGCSMNKFCTLEELCLHYNLELKSLLNKLEERRDNAKPR